MIARTLCLGVKRPWRETNIHVMSKLRMIGGIRLLPQLTFVVFAMTTSLPVPGRAECKQFPRMHSCHFPHIFWELRFGRACSRGYIVVGYFLYTLPASCSLGTGGKVARGSKLTTHVHVMSKFRIYGAVLLLHV